MKTDSFWLSLAWGRIGIAVIAIIAWVLGMFGHTLSQEEQQAWYSGISHFITNVGLLYAGIMAARSKAMEVWRATKGARIAAGITPADVKPAETKSNPISGFVKIGALIALLLLGTTVTVILSGCSYNKPYAQQVMEQGGSRLQQSRAAYLESRQWYNDSQRIFIDRINALPKTAETDPDVIQWVARMSNLFDQAGDVLNKWQVANNIIAMDASEEEFRKARDELIDAGVNLFVE